MACPKVRVKVEGKEVEVEPLKAWRLAPRGRKGVVVGIVMVEGRKRRVKLPDDYPAPCP